MEAKQSFADLIKGEQPILVDFSAEWCGPCKMLAPILKQVKDDLKESVKIIKIDIDRNPALANNYQISGVPTLILFRKGQILWRQSGVVPAHQLKQIISAKIAS